jgi:hypothetical protein
MPRRHRDVRSPSPDGPRWQPGYAARKRDQMPGQGRAGPEQQRAPRTELARRPDDGRRRSGSGAGLRLSTRQPGRFRWRQPARPGPRPDLGGHVRRQGLLVGGVDAGCRYEALAVARVVSGGGVVEALRGAIPVRLRGRAEQLPNVPHEPRSNARGRFRLSRTSAACGAWPGASCCDTRPCPSYGACGEPNHQSWPARPVW